MAQLKPKPELPGMTGPGVERVSIPEIDAAIEQYVSIRDKRMKFLEEEIELKDELKKLMRANADKIGTNGDGVVTYVHDDLRASLIRGADDVKVKRSKPDDDDGDD